MSSIVWSFDESAILASMTALRMVCTAAAHVEAKVALDIVEGNSDEQVVNVVAAQMRVAVGGDDFEDAFVQFEDRDVERAAAEIVNGDRGSLFLVEPVA